MQYQKPLITQIQTQKLSPQMIQSIKLMALPLLELKEEILQEVEINPALEILEERSEVSLESLPEDRETDYDTELRFENSSDPGFSPQNSGDQDSKHSFLEGAIARPESLQDHLLWQLRLQPIPQSQRELGERLIQNLDSDGFYLEDPYTLCKNKSKSRVDSVIAMIRSFEPPGICVPDFRSSLILQAEMAENAPYAVLLILHDYMELLEHGKYNEIQKALKLTEAELTAALSFIKTLNPFPGRLYSGEQIRYVIPDVQIRLKDGEIGRAHV